MIRGERLLWFLLGVGQSSGRNRPGLLPYRAEYWAKVPAGTCPETSRTRVLCLAILRIFPNGCRAVDGANLRVHEARVIVPAGTGFAGARLQTMQTLIRGLEHPPKHFLPE